MLCSECAIVALKESLFNAACQGGMKSIKVNFDSAWLRRANPTATPPNPQALPDWIESSIVRWLRSDRLTARRRIQIRLRLAKASTHHFCPALSKLICTRVWVPLPS